MKKGDLVIRKPDYHCRYLKVLKEYGMVGSEIIEIGLIVDITKGDSIFVYWSGGYQSGYNLYDVSKRLMVINQE